MPGSLAIHAVDRSTIVVTAAFTDATGAAVAPNSGLTWTLTNESGGVVNSRSAVPITAATSITIVLSGADLAYADGARRVVTVEGTYNSSHGNNLPLRNQVTFVVDDLVAVV